MSGSKLNIEDWERIAREAGFDAAKMASLCAISDRHLQRIFKKDLQRTPGQWTRELQCRIAKDLISRGYSCKAAAAEVNFANQSHFCHVFKKIFGASPQTFAPHRVMNLRFQRVGEEAAKAGLFQAS